MNLLVFAGIQTLPAGNASVTLAESSAGAARKAYTLLWKDCMSSRSSGVSAPNANVTIEADCLLLRRGRWYRPRHADPCRGS